MGYRDGDCPETDDEIRQETSHNLRNQRDELLQTLRRINDAIDTVGWDYIDSRKLCKLLDQVLIKYKEE